jgi:hypothetical protein
LRYFIGGQAAFAADRVGLVDLRQFQAFAQAGDGLAQLGDFALGADQRHAHGIVGIGARRCSSSRSAAAVALSWAISLWPTTRSCCTAWLRSARELFQFLAQGAAVALEHLRFPGWRRTRC